MSEEKDLDLDEALGGFEADEAEKEMAEEGGEGKVEAKDFLSRYVKPHPFMSRVVTEADIERVKEEAHVLYNLCFTYHGLHSGGFAIASSQIDDKDPLRFFVTAEKEIIINPEIIKHTSTKVDSREGCLSFPNSGPTTVQRWNKCTVRYQTLDGDKLSDFIEEDLTGRRARIYQHELDHMNAIYIYGV